MAAAGADAFCDWCLKAIADTIDLFCEKFLVCFDACVTDLMAKTLALRNTIWTVSSPTRPHTPAPS